MEALVHYIKSGRSFGPISIQDFLDLFDSQVIGPSDLVRVEGVSSWTSAGTIVVQARAGLLATPSQPVSLRPTAGLPAGSHTVFTSAPPIPRLRVPQDALRPSSQRACPRCERPAAAESSFCKYCGGDLRPRRCSACAHANDPDALFCGNCGQRLGSLAPPPAR